MPYSLEWPSWVYTAMRSKAEMLSVNGHKVVSIDGGPWLWLV